MKKKLITIIACLAALTSCEKYHSHHKSTSGHAHAAGSAYESSFNAAMMSPILCDAGDGYRESKETAETAIIDDIDHDWHDKLN